MLSKITVISIIVNYLVLTLTLYTILNTLILDISV